MQACWFSLLRELKIIRILTERKITAANADEQIKQLYQTAFPEDEQIPWDDLIRLIDQMNLDFTSYYEALSYITFLRNEWLLL